MPRTSTLHGSAPDENETAVVILDLISDFEFENGSKLARAAQRIAGNVARLSARAREAGVPIIYLNDNRGRWRSDRSEDRKSTRLNSSHVKISYAVFCL